MGQVVQTAKHAKIRHVPRQKPSAEALAAGFAHSARTCIVLREPFPKEKMIRFAISPDGLVTPDILENLPGRGLWVFAKPDIITRAIKQNAFARAGKANTKKPITLPDDLMQTICTILAKRLIGLISLSRRNGRAICGFERIKTNLPLQRGQLLLQASDGSPNQLKKINHPENHHAALMCLTSAELGLAFGRDHVIHALLNAHGLNRKIQNDARRLAGLRNPDSRFDTHTNSTTGTPTNSTTNSTTDNKTDKADE